MGADAVVIWDMGKLYLYRIRIERAADVLRKRFNRAISYRAHGDSTNR